MTAVATREEIDQAFRLADCLQLLAAGPKPLRDDHKAIFYLLRHKQRHAIISTRLLERSRMRRDGVEIPALREWELLPGYDTKRVQDARLRGAEEAEVIRMAVPRSDWAQALEQIQHPLIRDTAADQLRGWWPSRETILPA